MTRIAEMTERDDAPRLLTKPGVERLVQQVLAMAPEGTTEIVVASWWGGELRWARNRVTTGSDRRDGGITVIRTLPGFANSGVATTNQLDTASLEATIRSAERVARLGQIGESEPEILAYPSAAAPHPLIWSDTTFNATAAHRAELSRLLVAEAETQSMSSAGYVEMRSGEWARFTNDVTGNYDRWAPNTLHYSAYSMSQCSMTVRHPKGVGSGWAAQSSFDWSAIDGPAAAKQALEKCLHSLNPVAIEPGRYTVVLEPQAVYDLLVLPFNRENNEGGHEGVFSLGWDETISMGRTKLGLKVADERITIRHDPMDPTLGTLPMAGMAPVTYIERGVLKALSYHGIDRYGEKFLRDNSLIVGRDTFSMSGGTSSVEQMIQSTKRGLFVTRFSGVTQLHSTSGLQTGVTRDGLWLIENGKIAKAVKNMRFTESPIFVLNSIEELGVPVPVYTRGSALIGEFSPPNPAIVPALKARDFGFTSMVDAI